MKRFFQPLLLAVSLLVAPRESVAQGSPPTPEEEAKVIAVLGLVPGKVVGEIGAGRGQLAISVAKAVGPGGRVYATELPSMRDLLRRNAKEAGVSNLEVVAAESETTGLAPECCEAVFMRDVYHHLTAPGLILADIRKALRPEGRLLIIDFEPRASLPAVDGVKENRRGHGIFMSLLVEELKEAGFEVVSQDPAWRSGLFAVTARLGPKPAK